MQEPNSVPPSTFVVRENRAKWAWSGGHGIDVAEVRVNLSDLAAHFFAPIHQDGNTVALVLAAPGVGAMTVVGENVEICNRCELSPEDVQWMAFTYQQLLLVIGRDADLEAAKLFVRGNFPSWAQVYFYDECQDGRPAEKGYEGPSGGN